MPQGAFQTHGTNGGGGLARLFHIFPDGRTGAGLLLLRLAVGVAILIQGGLDLARRPDPTIGSCVVGALAVAAGAALIAGFLTPVAAALTGLSATGIWISIIPAPYPSLFSRPCIALLVAIAAAIFLLGPGAFSLDARLFGLREIIIPPRVPARD